MVDDHIVDANEMVPIFGPPDLEGVPDDALFLLYWKNNTTVRYAKEVRAFCDDAPSLTSLWHSIIWHIPLGVIEPPRPEVTLDDLPTCRGGEWECNDEYFVITDGCGYRLPWFDDATPAEVLADMQEFAANMTDEQFKTVLEMRESNAPQD